MRVRDDPAVVTLPAEIEQDSAEPAADGADSVVEGVSPAYRALCEAVASGAQVVVADLTGTTFCDYPAFRQLVAIHHLAATSDVQLRLAMPADGTVRRWLEFLAHHRLVRVYPGLMAAKTALPPSVTELPASVRVIAAGRADALD